MANSNLSADREIVRLYLNRCYPPLFDRSSDPPRIDMHDMRFSAGQAALKFNKLGPGHVIDIRANIEVGIGAAELKRGHGPNPRCWHLQAVANPPSALIAAEARLNSWS